MTETSQPSPTQARSYRLPVQRVWLSYVFLAINLLVFGGLSLIEWYYHLNPGSSLAIGWKSNTLINAGQVWRLLTPIFLHANVVHVAMNTLALSALGPAVESPFGWRRLGITYILAGIWGNFMSYLASPSTSVGASGAIFGLLGALLVYNLVNRRIFGSQARARLQSLVRVILLNLALGLLPGIDNWAHLGGLLAGAALSWMVSPRFALYTPPDRSSETHVIDTHPLSGWVLAEVAFFVLATAILVAVAITRY